MTLSSRKTLGFLLVAILGVYGCAKGPVSQGPAEPDKATVARIQRLEDDVKATAAARDQFRQKMLAAEELHAQLKQESEQFQAAAGRERDGLAVQLDTRTAERDGLTVERNRLKSELASRTAERDTLVSLLKSRTAERDNLQAQYDVFRKTIKDALGQAEVSLRTGPTTTLSATGAEGAN